MLRGSKVLTWLVLVLACLVGGLTAGAPSAFATICGNTATGDPWLLGCSNNTATLSTNLTGSAVGETGLYVSESGAESTGAQFNGAMTGVYATATGGSYAVDALGGTYGVFSTGDTYGVYGTGAYGVDGSGTTNGVYGTSSGGDAVVGHLANSSTGVNGVTGSADNGGNGVNAETNSPYTIGEAGHYNAALFAQDTSTGTSLWARNLNDGGQAAYVEAYGPHSTALTVCGCSGATALNVTGPSRFAGKTTFSRSGVVRIAAGTSSKAVTLPGVTTSSMVLATAQQAASAWVKAAIPASGKFTIHLTGPAPSGGLKVAYFVLN